PADARPAPNAFDVTEDGRIALVALVDPHRLVLLDLLNGPTLKSLEGHQQFIRSAALAPDGKRAFSIDQDRTLRIWKLDDEAAKVAARKPETKPETKPEIKPETKPETKAEAKLD